jgi:hypothetical protein
MRCEVVAIGTELLLGIIVDSNSAWTGEQLWNSRTRSPARTTDPWHRRRILLRISPPSAVSRRTSVPLARNRGGS